MKVLYLLAALLLVGCVQREDTAVAAKLTRNYVEYSVGGSTINEFQLSDGTRCVVNKWGYSGGITCEWRQPVVLMQRPE